MIVSSNVHTCDRKKYYSIIHNKMENVNVSSNKGLLVAAAVIVTISTGIGLSSYAQTPESVNQTAPTNIKEGLTDEQKLELKELHMNNDHEGIMQFFEEQGIEKPDFKFKKGGFHGKMMLQDLTDEQKELMKETHEKVKSGELTMVQAHQSLIDQGLELPELTEEMKTKMEAHQAVRNAMEAGDYNAWLDAAKAERPDAPYLEGITEEKFEVMQQMHDAKEAGDIEAAKNLAEEAGIEFRPLKKMRGGQHGMMNEFKESLSDEQKEALNELKESGDKEQAMELLESYGLEKPEMR